MKPTLLFATLSMVFATPTLSAKSELETLRARCAEQERQIQQLEQDNSKLRSAAIPSRSLGSQNELVSTAATKPVEAARPAESPKPASAPASASYTVKAGDSLEKIARKLSTSPATLAKSNGLKTNAMIHPGQKLKVPGTAVAAASGEPAAAPAKAPAIATTSAGKSYTVKDNDTYSSISRKTKVSVSTLITANPKVKPTALRTGQVISLGASKSTESPTPAPIAKSSAPAQSAPVAAAKAPPRPATTPVLATKSPAPAAKTHESAETAKTSAPIASAPAAKSEPAAAAPPASTTAESSSPNPEKKIHPVTIDGEMTYGEFASKHGTDPERLNALNGLDLSTATVLAKGSELYVPAQP